MFKGLVPSESLMKGDVSEPFRLARETSPSEALGALQITCGAPTISTKAIGHEARGTLKSRRGFPCKSWDRAAKVERSPT